MVRPQVVNRVGVGNMRQHIMVDFPCNFDADTGFNANLSTFDVIKIPRRRRLLTLMRGKAMAGSSTDQVKIRQRPAREVLTCYFRAGKPLRISTTAVFM